MTEKGYKDGLVSKVLNSHSHKKYSISTAQELGKDYWTTNIFPTVLFGLIPNVFKSAFTIVRNNKEEAHAVHQQVKDTVKNVPEHLWVFDLPDPKPVEGWSQDAMQRLNEQGVEPD